MVQKNSIDKKALIICGPTASGKSDLAIECAKLLESEIISADSMYIYKKLNIGTAKPTFEEMSGIKHHMIDVSEPNENFSVGEYKRLAEPILQEMFRQGKIPVICGGTGFYINSLIYDFSYGNSSANLEAREKYKKLAEQYGNEYVFNILKEKDLKSAEKLHFNDLKRVIRALEIYENGQKKSDIIDDLTPRFNFAAYMLGHERDVLYERINIRVDKMVKSGLIDEVESLINEGYERDSQCFQGIGYKEIVEHLDGLISIEEAVEKIKLNTRHYAKRQLTYFKKMPNLKILKPQKTTILAKKIVGEL